MIRVTHVSVVEHPDVSDIQDLVVRSDEELSEILSWLKDI